MMWQANGLLHEYQIRLPSKRTVSQPRNLNSFGAEKLALTSGIYSNRVL